MIDCLAYFGMVNMQEIENMTVVDYERRMEAKRLRDFDKTHDQHHAAFLYQVAGSTEKVGKDIVPKFKKFSDFFNVTEQRKRLLGDLFETPKLTPRERLLMKANTLGRS